MNQVVATEYTRYQRSSLMKSLAAKAHGDAYVGQTSSATYNEIARQVHALALPSGSHVLDAGCGNGCFSHKLALDFPLRITGVDISEDLVAEASRLAVINGIDSCCEFAVEDFTKLTKHQSPTFNLILCVGSLYWGQDVQMTLKTWSRLIKPQGHLLLYLNLCYEKLTKEEEEAIGNTKFIHEQILQDELLSSGWKVCEWTDETNVYIEWLKRWCEGMQEMESALKLEMGHENAFQLVRRFTTYLSLAKKGKVKRIVLKAQHA